MPYFKSLLICAMTYQQYRIRQEQSNEVSESLNAILSGRSICGLALFVLKDSWLSLNIPKVGGWRLTDLTTNRLSV